MLAREHRIRAVIDLREEAKDDEELLKSHGIALLHLPTPDMCGVSTIYLDDGVRFACDRLDRGERVLIHCTHGIGRSATLALCVLVSQGHSPLGALEQMKQARELISPSTSQFACWVEWMTRHAGKGADAAWRVPALDAFEAIAYRRAGGV